MARALLIGLLIGLLFIFGAHVADAKTACERWTLDAYFCADEVKTIDVIMEDYDGDYHAYKFDRTQGWHFVSDF